MKIIPVILCGGGGTRLWDEVNHNQIKQFIDFGGWTLFEKTLQRIKCNIYDLIIFVSHINDRKKTKNYISSKQVNFAKSLIYKLLFSIPLSSVPD